MSHLNLSIFKWSSLFETGLEEVDAEHQHLIKLINELGELYIHRASVEEIIIVMNALKHYAENHFGHEEGLMLKNNFGSAFQNRHVLAHTNFAERIATDLSVIRLNPTKVTGQLLAFLVKWMATHVLITDRSMVHILRDLKNGITFSEAEARATQELSEQSHEAIIMAMSELYDRLGDLTSDLIQANTSLQQQLIQDPLTGLLNRRYFEETIPRELHLAIRKHIALSVALVDIDNFKSINVTYGHEGGDNVLKAVGKLIANNVRRSDIVCRYDGNRFAVVLIDCVMHHAQRQFELLLDKLKLETITFGGKTITGLTFTAGVAQALQHGKTREEMVKAAEVALSEAKAAGGARVAMLNPFYNA